ncbi:MAG: 50S ribosomal protein L4 [Bacillota bacterium]|nr:50S ribosomal protein L4 [Bacillota bacterium]MDI7250437.1 50S ribosomal protein L4 [Bacillota bacterium]
MAQVPVVNPDGERVGEMDLADGVFGQEPNEYLMHAAVVAHLARRRVGTASTLTRGEVSGGGRKPWRQKGTGRARHGSIRSPLWRKGGVVFGPKPRDYGYAIPVKARRQALRSALSARVREGAVTVVQGLGLEGPRTRALATMLKKLGVDGSALIVTAQRDRNLELSARNLPGVETALAHQLHTYQVLNHDFLLFTPEAVQRVEEVLS